MGKNIVDWNRPDSYWDVVCRHFPLVLLTGTPLAVAFTATPGGLPLMPCTFKGLTGYPCPFCGFTRCFFSMASGDWAHAFSNCPLGTVLFVLCALVFVWNVAGLVLGISLSPVMPLGAKAGQGKYVVSAGGLLLLANWVYRLVQGLK